MTIFRSIANWKGDYPKWFAEGKTRLIPKPGVFASENQRPVVHSMSPQPMDNHFGDLDEQQRGAKTGCTGTVDNLLIDRMITLDCQRNKRSLSIAWIDMRKAYDSVDYG